MQTLKSRIPANLSQKAQPDMDTVGLYSNIHRKGCQAPQRGTDVVPVEIKSAATVNRDFFKGLKRFKASVSSSADGILVYGGSETRMQNGVQVICLDSLDDVLSRYFH